MRFSAGTGPLRSPSGECWAMRWCSRARLDASGDSSGRRADAGRRDQDAGQNLAAQGFAGAHSCTALRTEGARLRQRSQAVPFSRRSSAAGLAPGSSSGCAVCWRRPVWQQQVEAVWGVQPARRAALLAGDAVLPDECPGRRIDGRHAVVVVVVDHEDAAGQQFGTGMIRVLRHSIGGCGRCAGLLVRGLRPTTGQVLHGLPDTGGVPLDVLHVQLSGDNLTVSDLEHRHPAHLKGLPVAAGA